MAEKINLGDCQSAGFCIAGARRWFAIKGLDFRKFVREGMTREELGQDHYVDKIFEMKAKRNG